MRRWEVVTEDDPRGQPSPMYRGLVCLVSCSPSIAVVTADGSTVEKSEWEAVARLIASAPDLEYRAAQVPQLRTRIAQLKSELAAAREAGAREFAEWADSQRPSWRAQSTYGEVLSVGELFDRWLAATAKKDGE